MEENSEFYKILSVLKGAIREAKRLQRHFKVAQQTKRQKLFALMVLNELVRKCESIVAMAESEKDAGIDTVTRAAFENYADFKNLFLHGDDYCEYMIWAASNQQRSFLQPMFEEESVFSISFEKSARKARGMSAEQLMDDTKKIMQKTERDLPAKFKTKKGKVQRRDMLKFELAGLEGEYNILYRHLSASSHGRIFGMVDGIFDGEEVKWPPSKPKLRPLVALDSACAMLLENSAFLARKYRKPLPPIKKVIEAHTKLRGGEGISVLGT